MQRTETLCQHSEIGIGELADHVSITSLAIIGGAQRGKTTLAKHIVKALTLLPNTKIRIWDSSTKWLFESPAQAVFKVPQPKLLVYKDNELVGYEYQEPITYKTLQQLLAYKCIVFDSSEIDDIEYERQFQQRVILHDKIQQISLVKTYRGQITQTIVHAIEETQGNLSTNTLRRNDMLWLAKCISVSANYGISWLIVSRRPSEVSTQIFEHTSVKCIAQTNQPNDIRKLKRILTWEDIEQIKTLGLGEFVVLTPNGVHNLQTTKYTDKDPEQISLVKPEKPSLWSRIFNR